MSNNVWEFLGISPTSDESSIRKRYAELVRQYRPDSHPEEFSTIRSAYEEALRMARSQPEEREHPIGIAADVTPYAPASAPEEPPASTGPYDWNLDAEQEALRQAMNNADAAMLSTWLDESFSKARDGTFDAMQDLEVFVANLLLHHAAPPPSFVEACAHKLNWQARWPVLADALGHDQCMRLRLLLQLAVQYRFAKNFAANTWHRYLFSAVSTRLPTVGWTPLLLRANRVAQAWRQQCEKAGFSGYLAFLNPHAEAHSSGDRVQSCDIKHALLVAIYVLLIAYKAPTEPPAIWMLALLGVSSFVVISGFRPLLRVARKKFVLDPVLAGLRNFGLVFVGLALMGGLAQHELAAILWLEEPLLVFKGICFAYVLVILLWIHWWMVRGYDTESRVFKLRNMDRADDIWWENENGESD